MNISQTYTSQNKLFKFALTFIRASICEPPRC